MLQNKFLRKSFLQITTQRWFLNLKISCRKRLNVLNKENLNRPETLIKKNILNIISGTFILLTNLQTLIGYLENYFYLQLHVHYERYLNYLTFRKVQSEIVTVWKPRSNDSKEKNRWLASISSTHYHILTHYEFTCCFFNKNSFSRYLKQNVTTKSDKHMLPCFKQYNGTIERKHGRILT